MASFTDNPNISFAPYTPENPIDAMLQVGITKQRQYDQGVEKVQSYIDSLNGFDISKPEIKQYVQAKIQELHQNVNNVSGDFSDQRLINQIGGAVSKISNDPVVANGLLATSSIRAGYQQIQDSRKKGESNPANEWVFQDVVNKWMTDGQHDTTLNAQYTPYTDVTKKVMDIVKEMHPGMDIPEDSVKIDNDGNIVFNSAIPEGLSRSRVQDAVNLVFQDPSVQNQLAISSQYKYRGMDGKAVFQSLVGNTQAQLSTINDAILATQSKLSMSTAGNKQALQNEIDSLKKTAENRISSTKDLIQGLTTNVDGVKSQLLSNDMKTNLIGTFAYQKLVQNPLWNAQMEERKFKLQQDEFTYKQQHDLELLQIDRAKLEIDRIKAEKEAKAKKPGDVETYLSNQPVAQAQGEKTAATMYDQRDTLLNKFLDTNKGAINNFANTTKVNPPYKKNSDGTWTWNIGEGGYSTQAEANTASQKLVREARTENSKGTATDPIASDVSAIDRAWDDYNSVDQKIKKLEADSKPQLEQISKEIGTRTDGRPYSQDWFDLYAATKELPGKEISEKRLTAKYGEGWKSAWQGAASKSPWASVIGGGNKNTPVPPNELDEYQKFASKLSKNKSIIEVQKNIDQKYRDAQPAYQDKAVFFNPVDDKGKENMENAFTASLNAQSVIPGTGDADEILKLMKSSDKGSKDNKFFSHTTYDKGGNKIAYIGITRPGGETKEVAIPYDTFVRNFPNAVADDSFNQTYGTRLAINSGENTFQSKNDNNIDGGRTSAFNFSSSGGKYNVQYHLFRDASNDGQYKIRMWITDKKSGTTLLNGQEYAPTGVGRSLTPAQLQAQLDILKNPQAIEAYLSEYAK